MARSIVPTQHRAHPGQLYHLATDPGETQNLYDTRPEVVAELKALREQSKTSVRSRPHQP